MTGYFLTDEQQRLLQECVDFVRNFQGNPRGRAPHRSLETQMSPEVYIAKAPSGGIPALSESGGDKIPGSAECDIYNIIFLDEGPRLTQVGGFTKTVYNISDSDIEEGFLQIQRNKYGTWNPVIGGSSSSNAESRIYHGYLEDDATGTSNDDDKALPLDALGEQVNVIFEAGQGIPTRLACYCDMNSHAPVGWGVTVLITLPNGRSVTLPTVNQETLTGGSVSRGISGLNRIIISSTATGGQWSLSAGGETTSLLDFDCTSEEVVNALHALSEYSSLIVDYNLVGSGGPLNSSNITVDIYADISNPTIISVDQTFMKGAITVDGNKDFVPVSSILKPPTVEIIYLVHTANGFSYPSGTTGYVEYYDGKWWFFDGGCGT